MFVLGFVVFGSVVALVRVGFKSVLSDVIDLVWELFDLNSKKPPIFVWIHKPDFADQTKRNQMPISTLFIKRLFVFILSFLPMMTQLMQ